LYFTSTNNNDFICTPIAPPAPEAIFYEIKPALLNLVMKEQFFGVSTDDAAAHLNNFVKLCEMKKYKDVDGDIIKLKLFPFSLRGRAKDWLLSLPKNSIDLWAKCKDAFIGRYYPPAKIIALCSNIMKFSQFDNEHVAQAWEHDMLGLPPLENCYFDVPLADVAKKKPLGSINDVLIWLKITLFPLISLFWILNAMLLVLLFWEDLFIELLVLLLI
jgi:hypothetical protein